MDNVFLNEALKRLLNLPTHPVSVKYIGTFDEDVEWELADLGFYRPRNPARAHRGVEGSNGPKKLGPEQFWKWLLT